jgi:hypothetical protein
MTDPALEAAKEQLKYWQGEYEAARLAADFQRLAQCKRFIKQCELVVSALDDAAKRNPPTNA